MISELVPDRHQERGTFPDVDLTGALLDYLDLSSKAIGQLVLRDAQLYGTTRFNVTEISGDAWFTRAVSYGKLECDNVVFRGRSNFPHLTAHDRVSFEGARLPARSRLLVLRIPRVGDPGGQRVRQIRGLAAHYVPWRPRPPLPAAPPCSSRYR